MRPSKVIFPLVMSLAVLFVVACSGGSSQDTPDITVPAKAISQDKAGSVLVPTATELPSLTSALVPTSTTIHTPQPTPTPAPQPTPTPAVTGSFNNQPTESDLSLVAYTAIVEVDTNFEQIDLFTMREDGTDVVRLTDNDAAELYAALSPDGDWITYVSFGIMEEEYNQCLEMRTNPVPTPSSDSNIQFGLAAPPTPEDCLNSSRVWHLYIQKTNVAESPILLKTYYSNIFNPFWSHDGRVVFFIIYEGTTDQGSRLGCLKGLIASSPSQVHSFGCGDKIRKYKSTSISSNGRKILLQDGNDIVLMVSENTAAIPLKISGRNRYDYLEWSPDGRKYVFRSSVPVDYNSFPWRIKERNLFIQDIDTFEYVDLTYGKNVPLSPSWSPDGSELVFVSDNSGRFEMHIIGSDGNGRIRLSENLGGVADQTESLNKAVFYAGPYGDLTEEKAKRVRPRFSADGTKVIFMSDLKGNKDTGGIYSVNVDGSGLQAINTDKVYKILDVWQPNLFVQLADSFHPLGASAKAEEYIIFTSGPEYGEDIFASNTDGSGITRLTFQGYRETGVHDVFRSFGAIPAPDGSSIVYQSSNLDNYIRKNSPKRLSFEFEGSGLKILDFGDSGECWLYADDQTRTGRGKEEYRIGPYYDGLSSFHWSPDSQTIVLAEGGIKIIDVHNRDNMQSMLVLTENPDHRSPSWSPDSAKIAFMSGPYFNDFSQWLGKDKGSEATINIVDRSGIVSEIFKINDGAIGDPVWSPDGTKIAFQAYSGDGGKRTISIYIANSDGTDNYILTDGTGLHLYKEIVWSPDGKKIVFVAQTDEEESDIFLINVDGTGEIRLSNAPGIDEDVSYSPSGKQLLFTSTRHGEDKDIYLMNLDGTNVVAITNNDLDDTDPKWSNSIYKETTGKNSGIFDFSCPPFSPIPTNAPTYTPTSTPLPTATSVSLSPTPTTVPATLTSTPLPTATSVSLSPTSTTATPTPTATNGVKGTLEHGSVKQAHLGNTQVDLWKFDGKAGSIIKIVVKPGAVVQIKDNQGDVKKWADGSKATTTVLWTEPKNEEYLVEVSEGTAGVGDYTIELIEELPTTYE